MTQTAATYVLPTLRRNILVTKAAGDQEPFELSKLDESLRRAGASERTRERIAARVIERLKRDIPTEEIYRHAFMYLKEEEAPSVAARYSIKRAIFALGPSGFPFEQFLAEVLRAHGWRVQTGMALTGRCAPHEVDVVGERNGTRIGIEAKFHNVPGGKTDIKDALYVHARYQDLARAPLKSNRIDEGWLVTNTRFTRNAIRYAQCSNLTLVGWDYPRRNNLLDLIEQVRVHPLTALTTLTEAEKRRLLENNIVLCKSVQTPHLLEEYGVKPRQIPLVLEEARNLCSAV